MSTSHTCIARVASTPRSSTGSRPWATTSSAGGAAISSSAARTRSRFSVTARSLPPATPAAAAPGSSSDAVALKVGFERRDLAVQAGALAEGVLDPYRFDRDLEQLVQPLDARMR